MLDDVVARLRHPDRWLLAFVVAAFVLWIAAVGPLRSWASEAGIRGHWTLGVAPSFFAGGTLAAWQALAAATPPVASVVLAGALVSLAEVAHLAMPRQTADLWDVVTGLAGAALSLPLLKWRWSHRAA
ncbi:hypothetical protein [Rubrivirga marina]|uniref:VanZ-like domain-containing protein n=1 Tax=Rubrivirga marina TaxID=1196024 RepID=A0A271J166_9BACT|nr:hypothetical protein [Rubrivirga marina]PAP77203.1 hypothetical protein BSZ37_12560 [Rubrivirga marina]